MDAPTPTELRATLVSMVAGATETSPARWERMIGQVDVLPIVFNPRCNWRIEVQKGPAKNRDVIEKAIEILRGEHPYVRTESSPGG